MSKGSKRRPENTAAIRENWEQALGLPKKRKRDKTVQTANAAVCIFCYRILKTCKSCGKQHCSCVRIANCRTRSPKRVGDPLEQSPYGFTVDRSGCRDIGAPAEKDTPAMINQEFIKKRYG